MQVNSPTKTVYTKRAEIFPKKVYMDIGWKALTMSFNESALFPQYIFKSIDLRVNNGFLDLG